MDVVLEDVASWWPWQCWDSSRRMILEVFSNLKDSVQIQQPLMLELPHQRGKHM